MGYAEKYNNENGDIIIGRVGAKCGNVRFVNGKKWISDNALVANTNQDKTYISMLIHVLDLNKSANQNAQPLITGSMVKEHIVCLPPMDEQAVIINHIVNSNLKIDQTILKIEKEITLLEEYKASLIYEAVTGKIDVRGELIN
jgi:type I restriction enzyme S subunit